MLINLFLIELDRNLPLLVKNVKYYHLTHSLKYLLLVSMLNISTYSYAATDCSAQSQLPVQECETLIAFYKNLMGITWTDQSTNQWNQNNTPCSWTGVTCSGGHVSEIARDGKNLSGSLPSLTSLTEIENLSLSNNQLKGSIPNLATQIKLRRLNLSKNQLSSLPTNFPSELEYIALNNNQLSGSITNSFKNLTKLQSLNLSTNQLTGALPNLTTASMLTELVLDTNQFSGAIPAMPERLSKLSLSANQLTGTLPTFPTSLRSLYLDNNQFSGAIPGSLSSLSELSVLELSYNKLTATDAGVIQLLTKKSPNWLDTQTISPEITEVKKLSATSMEIYWTPIKYTKDGGYYQVRYATSASGAAVIAGQTKSKTESSFVVQNLSQNQLNYFFFVDTFTPKHGKQQSDLLSAPTAKPTEGSNTSQTNCGDTATTGITQAECLTLVDLYTSTKGEEWTDSPVNRWKKNNLPCNWEGVACSGGHVTKIIRPKKNLVGSLPSLSRLTYLKTLSLEENKLTGYFPSDLPRSLTEINLSGNKFGGQLPESITQFNSSTSINLNYNKLTASDTVDRFLSAITPNWKNTQTVPPVITSLTALSTTSVQISWNPIAYTEDKGFYRVKYATSFSEGFYTEIGVTASKMVSSYTVTGLTQNTTYYFVVETYTPAHTGQPNELTSTDSTEMSVTTLLTDPIITGSLNGLSARGFVGKKPENNIFIGFNVQGITTKQLAMRGFGLHLSSTLLDPIIELRTYPKQALLGNNNNWQTDASAAQIEQLGLAPTDISDAALLKDLTSGYYTLQASSANQAGIVLIDLYDLNSPVTTQDARVNSISTRALVTADPVYYLYVGLLVRGQVKVGIRAIGQGLRPGLNTALDPRIEVLTFPDRQLIGRNNDWAEHSSATEMQQYQYVPPASTDAGMIINLTAGYYTIEMAPMDQAGIGLLEIQQLQ